MRRLLALLLVAAAAPAPVSAAPAEARTPNLTVEKRVPYSGGTELAFDGRYVYAGQYNGRTGRYQLPRQGGVRIYDTQATPPKPVGRIACAGIDMDVAVVRPGVLAVAHHASACGVRGNGLTVFDVRNPARPKRLSSTAVPSAHTLTAVPGTDYVYVSPGGSGSGYGLTSVVSVKDARKPRVVTTLRPDFFGCHDVTFGTSVTGVPIGVCTGWASIVVWDMTDPVEPKVLSRWQPSERGRDYQIVFAHGAAISPDGALLVVNDEAVGGHRCDGKDPDDAGALHLYDITSPTMPVHLGHIVPPRGRYLQATRDVATWCTSHQLNFVPGTRRLVSSWFTGGLSVWDLTVPVAPREEAYYMPPDALSWTAHWLGDRIWINDMQRGTEIVRMSLLPTGDPVVSPAWRPAGRRGTPAPAPRWRPSPGALLCPV